MKDKKGLIGFCLIFLLCCLCIKLMFPDGLFNITVNIGEQSSGAPSTDVEADMIPSTEVAAMLNAAAERARNDTYALVRSSYNLGFKFVTVLCACGEEQVLTYRDIGGGYGITMSGDCIAMECSFPDDVVYIDESGITYTDGTFYPRYDVVNIEDYNMMVGTVVPTSGLFKVTPSHRIVNTVLIPVVKGSTVSVGNGFAFNVFLFDVNGKYVECGTYGYTDFTFTADGYVRLSFGYGDGTCDDMTPYYNDLLASVVMKSVGGAK